MRHVRSRSCDAAASPLPLTVCLAAGPVQRPAGLRAQQRAQRPAVEPLGRQRGRRQGGRACSCSCSSSSTNSTRSQAIQGAPSRAAAACRTVFHASQGACWPAQAGSKWRRCW
jgi:hypothetical protein